MMGTKERRCVPLPMETSLEDLVEEHVRVFAGVMGPEGQERQALAQTNVLRHRWIAENGDQERELVRRDYKRMADSRVSTTDPEASPMHQKNKSASRLGYLTHYVVDGGRRA